ncbi:MAG: ABC transporter ATP-binding protein [Planctomycetota bacterium]|nr:ABC transporter ATP-binding protein [Planctomycetota bacterium]
MAILETHHLSRRYGSLVALDDLNLKVEAGECFGFIGPNGAWKTTTIKILATLLKPSSGEARVCGFTVGWQNTHIRPLIGYVPDFLGAYDDMLVREYLQFFASCYGITGSRRTQVVDDALSLTDLGGKAEAPISGLSRGMSQRLAVARVLLHDPEVLLLDEPASGLDPRARVEMRELLRTLRDLGKTILISSHILHELAELCTSVGILERGKLVFAGSVQSALDAARSGTRLECDLDGGMDAALGLLGSLDGVRSVAVDEGTKDRLVVHLETGTTLDAAGINARLVTAGVRVRGLSAERIDLETAFMRLTQGLVS